MTYNHNNLYAVNIIHHYDHYSNLHHQHQLLIHHVDLYIASQLIQSILIDTFAIVDDGVLVFDWITAQAILLCVGILIFYHF